MKLTSFQPWSRRWRAHRGSQILEKLLVADFSKPDPPYLLDQHLKYGAQFDVQFYRWSAKKQKWFFLGHTGHSRGEVKVVDDKLVAEITPTLDITMPVALPTCIPDSYGSTSNKMKFITKPRIVGELRCKAAQIHCCAPSTRV